MILRLLIGLVLYYQQHRPARFHNPSYPVHVWAVHRQPDGTAHPRPTAPTTSGSGNRLGAKTPEDLAILLLKCLKTNDKTTWMRCMHPDDDVETDEVSARKFDRHREFLMANGITAWSSIQYSRLMYPLRPMGGSKVDTDKTIPFSTVEFTYQNGEFVGSVRLGTFSLYENKWLVWYAGDPEDCRVIRQPHH